MIRCYEIWFHLIYRESGLILFWGFSALGFGEKVEVKEESKERQILFVGNTQNALMEAGSNPVTDSLLLVFRSDLDYFVSKIEQNGTWHGISDGRLLVFKLFKCC
jgi:hypothetical protein